VEKTSNAYLVDLDEYALEATKNQARELGVSVPIQRTHEFSIGRTKPWLRLWMAAQFLHDYAGASFVITSRLHCVLPCLAMGTSALLVVPNTQDERFAGLVPPDILESTEDFCKRTDYWMQRMFEVSEEISAKARNSLNIAPSKLTIPEHSWYTHVMDQVAVGKMHTPDISDPQPGLNRDVRNHVLSRI